MRRVIRVRNGLEVAGRFSVDGTLSRVGIASLVVGGEFLRRIATDLLAEGRLLAAPLLN